MMMRADNDKCSAEEMVLCLVADDVDACMAACGGEEEPGEEEELPGYATVSTKAAAAQTVALNAVDKKIGTVTLKAGDNDTTVTALEITKAGLGDAKDVATISLMRNGEYVTNSATLTNKVAKLRFRPNLVLKANGSETFDVVVSMAGKWTATAWGQHEFSVTAVTVSNGTFGGTPAKLGSLTTSNYEISTVTVAMDNATVSAWDTDVTITAVTITPKADATVDAFTITSNTNNEWLYDVVSNVKAYVDNKEVGKVTINEETIVVNGLSQEVEKNDDLTVVLRWDVKYVWNAPTFKLDVEKNHVVATETSTDERMASNATTATLTMSNGIWLTFKNLTKDTQTVAVNTKDVELLNLELSAAANVDILNYNVDFGAYTITASDLENIVISIDGNETDIAFADIIGNVVTFNDKVRDAFSIDANKTVSIKVTADVKAANTYGPLTFQVTSIKNTDTNTTVATTASKAWHQTKVNGAWTINVTKWTSAEGTTIKWGDATDILAFNIKAKSEDVTLNTVNFTLNTDLSEDKVDTVELYQWSTKLATLDGDKLTTWASKLNGQFKNLSKDVKADEQLPFSIRVTLTDIVAADLWKTIQATIAANDIVVKWKTSKQLIKNTQTINWKEYQVSTSKAAISVEKQWQYVFVTVNNTSAYDMVLSGFVVDIKWTMVNGENVLTNANITSANLLKDTKNGDDITANLANSWSTPWTAGTWVIPALVTAQWTVATVDSSAVAAEYATWTTTIGSWKIAWSWAYTAWDGDDVDVLVTATASWTAANGSITITWDGSGKLSDLISGYTFNNDIILKSWDSVTITLAGWVDAAAATYNDDGYPVITDAATFVIKMNSATTIDDGFYTVEPDSVQFWYVEDYAAGTALAAGSLITEKLSD